MEKGSPRAEDAFCLFLETQLTLGTRNLGDTAWIGFLEAYGRIS